MPESNFTALRERVRKSIRDTLGLLWSDSGLDELIREAAREYAIAAGTVTGEFPVLCDGTSVHSAPEDFLSVIRFFSSSGTEIPVVSWRVLHREFPDFRKVSGNFIRCAVFDFDGFGRYRIFPCVPAGTPGGTVRYRRIPDADSPELPNPGAIEAHCLYQAFSRCGKAQASNYLAGFRSAAARESGSMQTLSNRSPVRGGRFF